MSDLKIQAVVEASTEGIERAFDRVGVRSAQMSDKVKQAGEKAGKAVADIGNLAKASGEKLTREESSIVSSLKRIAAEAAKAKDVAASLNDVEFKIAAKGLDYAKFAPMFGVVDKLKSEMSLLGSQSAKATAAATAGLYGMQRSAKETALALRGVPAQFTDIVTSLQGGQKPLTVLLQQGGQLKDMFGGVGNAAKALGEYVMGLVNPYTIAAAAIVGLGYAAYHGAAESQELAKSLILSGNAAGTTASQLQDMAVKVSAATGASRSAASEVLGMVAATGKVTADNMDFVTASILRMSRSGGAEVDKMVEAFAALGKSPVEASLKLDETYNYLTASTYRQIKALEDQGKATEAAELAQKTFADASDQMAAKMEANLGSLERGWRSLADVIKAAGSVALSVGRDMSLNEKVAQLEKERARYLDPNSGQAGTAGSKAKYIQGIDAQLSALYEQVEAQKQFNSAKEYENKLKSANIAWAKEEEKYLDKKIKQERDIAKIRAEGQAANRPQKEIEDRVAAYLEKNAGSSKKAAKEAVSDYDKLIKSIKDKIAVQELEATTVEKLTEGQKLAAQVMEQISNGAIKVTAAEKQSLTTWLEKLVLIERQNDARDKQNKSVADWVKSIEQETASLDKQLDKAKEELAMMGMTAEEKDRLRASALYLAAAEKEVEAAALAANLALGSVTDQNVIEAYATAANAAKSQAEKLRELAAIESNKAGKEAAIKAAEESTKAWEKFASDIESSLTDALMRGFENGESFGENFVKTLQNTLKTTVLKIAVQAVVSPITQGITGIAQSALGNSAGSLLNLAGTWNSAYNMFAGGSNIYSTFATSGIGQALGLSSTIPTIAAESVGGVAAGTSLTGAGSSIAAAVPVAGWIAAGMMAAGSLYDKGYQWESKNTAFDPGMTINTGILNSLGISDRTAAIITGSSIQQLLFGGKKKTPTESTGDASKIYMADGSTQFVPGDFYANEGAAYVDNIYNAYKRTLDALGGSIETAVEFYYGGNTGKNSNSPNFRVIGGNQNYSYNSGEVASSDAAMQLETSRAILAALKSSSLPDYISSYFDALTPANMSQDQINAALQYAQNLKIAKDSMDTLGKSMSNLAGLSGGTVETLVQMAGGLDVLQSRLQAYYDGYFSESEKIANAKTILEESFADLNLDMPDTRAEFRALVESLDLTTESGQEAFTALMQLQSGFGQVADAAQAAANAAIQQAAATASLRQSWQDRLDLLTGDITQAQLDRRNDLAGTSDTGIQDIINQIYDREAANALAEIQADQLAAVIAAQREADAAALSQQKQAQSDMIEAQRQAQNDALNNAKQIADQFAAIVKTLEDYRRTLLGGADSILTPQQKYANAQAEFDKTAKLARIGNIEALQSLPDVGQTLLAAAKDIAATPLDYARDFAKVLAEVDNGIGTGTRQFDMASLQLNVAQAQLLELQNISASLSVEKSASASTLPVLVDNVQQMMADWYGFFDMSEIGKTYQYAAGSTTRLSQDKAMFTDLSGAKFVFEMGDSPYELAAQSTLWAEELKRRYGSATIPAFANGGIAKPGLALVGERGPELVQFPVQARVFTASQTSGFSDEIVSELRALREENKAQASAIVSMNTRLVRLHERWDGQGMPEVRAA